MCFGVVHYTRTNRKRQSQGFVVVANFAPNDFSFFFFFYTCAAAILNFLLFVVLSHCVERDGSFNWSNEYRPWPFLHQFPYPFHPFNSLAFFSTPYFYFIFSPQVWWAIVLRDLAGSGRSSESRTEKGFTVLSKNHLIYLIRDLSRNATWLIALFKELSFFSALFLIHSGCINPLFLLGFLEKKMWCRVTRAKGKRSRRSCGKRTKWLQRALSLCLTLGVVLTKWLKSLECLFRNEFHISRDCRRRRWQLNEKWLSSHFKKPASFFFDDNLRALYRWWWCFAKRRMTWDRPSCSCAESQKPRGRCNHPSLTERVVPGWSTSSYTTSNDAKPRQTIGKDGDSFDTDSPSLIHIDEMALTNLSHLRGGPCYLKRATNFKLRKARARARVRRKKNFVWRCWGRSLKGKDILLPTHWFVSYSKFWLTTWWLYHWGGSVGDDESVWRVSTWWSDEIFHGE